MKTVLLLSLLIVAAYGQSTQVSSCTSTRAELPMNTYIEGCTNPPCQLVTGTDVLLHIVFRAPHTIRSMKTVANAFLLFIPITYDLGDEAITCNYLTNTYCPLVKDEIVQYTLRMYMEPFFPEASVNIEFHIEDENQTPIICFRTGVTVIRPSRSANDTIALN